jgi:hypothetical protein
VDLDCREICFRNTYSRSRSRKNGDAPLTEVLVSYGIVGVLWESGL